MPTILRGGQPPEHGTEFGIENIEGAVIRLAVEHLPSGGVNKPGWL
ncbi:hypothetical protein ACH40E_41980 [Streptomyces acidicola]